MDIGTADIKPAPAYLVTAAELGDGDDELGALLMKNFLYTLARSETPVRTLALMNGGVRLACTGSPSLDDLTLLAEAGTRIESCGTCLDFLGLKGSLEVGEVGKMPEFVEMLQRGDTVVVG
jgi:selenium metabolism protein YedF